MSWTGRRRALCAALVAGVVAAACEPSSDAPTAIPSSPSCAVAVEFVDGGPQAMLTGSGFPSDQPATLTIDGPPEPATLTQATNPALRSDVRGVVLFELFPARENLGPARIELTAGGCTAVTMIEVLESMLPPVCPTAERVASGGAESDAYAAMVLADEPLAYWRFEEDAGPLAIATVGQDGAIQGDGVFGQVGPIPGSRALGLDGDGDRVNIDDIELPADFTVEGWISFCDNDISDEDGLFSQDGDVGPILVFRDAKPVLWSGDFNRGDVVWAEEPVEYLRWYHLALTRVGSEVTLFLDGEPLMTAPFEPTFPIGALGYSGFGSTTGQIDEIAIYDHALTPEQLAARFGAAS